jgi:hypothetical protein
LPCLALPCLALPCLALPCLALPLLTSIKLNIHLTSNFYPSLLQSLMRESITQTREIYPSFGQLIFFEIAFSNPFPVRKTFHVRIDDIHFKADGDGVGASSSMLALDGNNNNNVGGGSSGGGGGGGDGSTYSSAELQVVSNAREWAYYKQQYNINTPFAPSLFVHGRGMGDSDNGGGNDNNSGNGNGSANPSDCLLVLEANQTVYVPFKFQSFRAGQVSIITLASAPKIVRLFLCSFLATLRFTCRSSSNRFARDR